MLRKRIIVLVSDEQWTAIKAEAARAALSVANYVRQALGLPPERQGARKDISPTMKRRQPKAGAENRRKGKAG